MYGRDLDRLEAIWMHAVYIDPTGGAGEIYLADKEQKARLGIGPFRLINGRLFAVPEILDRP
jgi:hypothetical protein